MKPENELEEGKENEEGQRKACVAIIAINANSSREMLIQFMQENLNSHAIKPGQLISQ